MSDFEINPIGTSGQLALMRAAVAQHHLTSYGSLRADGQIFGVCGWQAWGSAWIDPALIDAAGRFGWAPTGERRTDLQIFIQPSGRMLEVSRPLPLQAANVDAAPEQFAEPVNNALAARDKALAK